MRSCLSVSAKHNWTFTNALRALQAPARLNCLLFHVHISWLRNLTIWALCMWVGPLPSPATPSPKGSSSNTTSSMKPSLIPQPAMPASSSKLYITVSVSLLWYFHILSALAFLQMSLLPYQSRNSFQEFNSSWFPSQWLQQSRWSINICWMNILILATRGSICNFPRPQIKTLPSHLAHNHHVILRI